MESKTIHRFANHFANHSWTNLLRLGKKCNVEKDFSSFFFAQYGNCYTYNLHLPEKENFEDTMEELAQNQQFHEDNEESLSGFTGPQVERSLQF